MNDLSFRVFYDLFGTIEFFFRFKVSLLSVSTMVQLIFCTTIQDFIFHFILSNQLTSFFVKIERCLCCLHFCYSTYQCTQRHKTGKQILHLIKTCEKTIELCCSIIIPISRYFFLFQVNCQQLSIFHINTHAILSLTGWRKKMINALNEIG